MAQVIMTSEFMVVLARGARHVVILWLQ